jgi:hypothetical protein
MTASRTADKYGSNSESIEEKPIVRIRSVLWREVERGGNANKLGRASINLPLEAIDILGLKDRGDIVAFVMKKKTKDIMLTNYYGSQPAAIDKTESDPEILLDRLLAQVLVLKSRKTEICDKWERGDLGDGEYLLQLKDANRQLEAIKENVKKILSGTFRGSADINSFMQFKLKSFYDEYANTFVSYVEDLAAKIESIQRSVDILDSAHSKGLFNNFDEYIYEKEEVESQLNMFRSLAKGTVDLLGKYK